MKKVLCSACGLVNLDRFVTYPHCAACNALLLDQAVPPLPLWKRKLSAPLWATLVGLCCVALGVAGFVTALETRPAENQRLFAYVQPPRQVRVGNPALWRLSLDSIEPDAREDAVLEALEVRFPTEVLRSFALVSIQPPPRRQWARGGGIYFEVGRVARSQTLRIELRPLRSGRQRVAFTLLSPRYSPFNWRSRLQVAPNRAN